MSCEMGSTRTIVDLFSVIQAFGWDPTGLLRRKARRLDLAARRNGNPSPARIVNVSVSRKLVPLIVYHFSCLREDVGAMAIFGTKANLSQMQRPDVWSDKTHIYNFRLQHIDDKKGQLTMSVDTNEQKIEGDTSGGEVL
jgi:hypothetical protein